MPHPPSGLPPSGPLPDAAVQTVGQAIQKLAAKRLGRAFVPLALLFLGGLGRMLATREGFILAAGAPLSAGAMLAYGLRVVARAFGKPSRPWMTLALAGGVVPPAYGLWVLGWEGLRTLASGGGFRTVIAGLLLSLLGAWVLRAWVRILELSRLAEVMALGASDAGHEGGGS